MTDVVDAVEANPNAFRADVLAQISRYDANSAVAGTVAALGAVAADYDSRFEREDAPVLSRGPR